MRRRTTCTIVAVISFLGAVLPPADIVGQEPEADADSLAAVASDSAASKGSFLSGWIGGTMGSAAGGLLLTSLGSDECYECYDKALAFVAGSTIGAAAGAYSAVKLSGGRPSGFAAAIGATLGMFAGLGVAAAFEDQSDGLALLTYTITQGAAAALGAGSF